MATRDVSPNLRFASGSIPGEIAKRFQGVDDFEDAKFPKFNKAQQRSTSWPHLIETKHVENRGLLLEAGNRLGRRCAPFWRVFRFNNLEN